MGLEGSCNPAGVVVIAKALPDEGVPVDVSFQLRQGRSCFRDFPEGCGPSNRFSAIAFARLVEEEILEYYSDPGEDRAYPPWRKVSCIRSFPPGCGLKAPRVNVEVALKSTSLESGGFYHKLPSVGNTLLIGNGDGGEAGKDTHQRKIGTTGGGTGDYMYGSDTEVLEMKRGEHENEQGKGAKRTLSNQQASMKQLLEQYSGPTDVELSTQRRIVQALMASPNCPWNLKGSSWRRNGASDAVKSNRKKHLSFRGMNRWFYS